MGKIVYIMGKSSTGKDTLYKELLRKNEFSFDTIVLYTTRPIREGERNGVEYNFVDEETYASLLDDGKIIEERCYNTFHGIWRYFTVDDGKVDFSKNYITIGTLESYEKIKAYYGEDKLAPVLVELDDGIRLQRALNRERKQATPKYQEMCRRFLADAKDFSEDRIKAAGINIRFVNDELPRCLKEIEDYIRKEIN